MFNEMQVSYISLGALTQNKKFQTHLVLRYVMIPTVLVSTFLKSTTEIFECSKYMRTVHILPIVFMHFSVN